MTITLKEVLDFAAAIGSIATAIGMLLTFRQLSLGRKQSRQQADNAAVGFVISAEGQLDPLNHTMLSAPPGVIKSVFIAEIDDNWTEDELRTFVYLRGLYVHVSRMVYIIHDKTIDIGMDDIDRADFMAPWEKVLIKYRNHPVMQRIHDNAVKNQDFNSRMLVLSRQIFGEATPDFSTKNASEST